MADINARKSMKDELAAEAAQVEKDLLTKMEEIKSILDTATTNCVYITGEPNRVKVARNMILAYTNEYNQVYTNT